MANIFRGPTFSEVPRRPDTAAGWSHQNRVAGLLVAVALPLLGQFPSTPQHPSHKLSANADTSRGALKTTTADVTKPFFVAPHYTAQHPKRRGHLNADTTQDSPLTLLAPSALAAPPTNAPGFQVDRRRPVADTSQDSPLTLLATVAVPPHFRRTPFVQLLDRPRIVGETSQGTSIELFPPPTPQVNLLRAPTFANAQKQRPGPTTGWTQSAALQAVAAPPFFNAPHPLVQRPRETKDQWQDFILQAPDDPIANAPTFGAAPVRQIGADTSQDTPKSLFADAVKPFADVSWRTPPQRRPGLPADATQESPIALLAVVSVPPPHFRRTPFVQLLDKPRTTADTSQESPLSLLAAIPAPVVNLQQAPPGRAPALLLDTSRGTPKTLFADATAPVFNPSQHLVERGRPVADTTQDSPLALLAPAAPFVNPPTLLAERPRFLADSTRQTLIATIPPDPFANPPGYTVDLRRSVVDTSQETVLALGIPVPPAPIANVPAYRVDPVRVNGDTSQSSSQWLLASVAPVSSGATADEIWNYVLSNGLTAGETLAEALEHARNCCG